ncbi:ENTH-domain-containing protein [Imleria badia]|nr:ENTH-domain-containing protein [Imleria badia]
MTVYDIKAMYNQARNAVLNISEMEAKVREATNDEPWGASSTLMQEIAQGTFNFQTFNEVMPCIYGRFMEKEARQWRQIYKALQLLEYLIKHGSERVVDDARSHISTLKMLRNFHYIDDKGKDEGQNVRNRARELVELLSDVEAIRTERRKAKTNRGKYTGTGNDPMNFSSGGSRYGGFGNDSLGGSGYYGDRMSGRDDYYSGGGSGGFRDNNGRRDFEEYTAGDDDTVAQRSSVSRSNVPSTAGSRTQTMSAPPASQQKEPETDLLGGFDDAPASTAPSATNAASPNKALPSLTGFDDDDFADFQAAPSPSSPASPPATRPTLMEMLNSSPPSRPQASTVNPLLTSQAQRATSPPSYNAPLAAITNNRQSQSFSPTPAQNTLWTSSQPLSPTTTSTSASTPATRSSTAAASNKAPGTAPPAPAKGLSGFEDLWSMSLGGPSTGTAAKTPTTGKSIKDLEKERAQAGIWASSQKPGGATASMGLGNAFGNFGSAKAGETTGGGDDLLL